MSTRSRIGYERYDGSIVSVYCHSDGYLEGVGATLAQHFTTVEAVKALTELGDLSFCEGPAVSPPGERIPGTTCSYKLWRNETGTEASTSENRIAYFNDGRNSGGEYIYLFDQDGKWVYTKGYRGDGQFIPLPADLSESDDDE